METVHVVPAEGARVLDPVTRKPLPAEGAMVPKNQYWLRRLRTGEVQLAKKRTASRGRREE